MKEKKNLELIKGGCDAAGGMFAGVMCMATVYLFFSPFAPMAAATGIACAIGGSAGCIYA
jgi:hypothetical protein